jgi:hypothetical protein
MPEKPMPPQETPPQATAFSPALAGGSDVAQIWPQVLAAIKSLPSRTIINEHFRLVSFENGIATLSYSTEAIYEMFKKTPDRAKHLEQAFLAVTGQSVRFHFQQGAAPAPVATSPAMNMSAPPAMPLPPVEPSEPVPQPAMTAPSVEPSVSETMASLATQATPRFDEPAISAGPSEPVTPPSPALVAAEPVSSPDVDDFDTQQAKIYTKELLQGKLID